MNNLEYPRYMCVAATVADMNIQVYVCTMTLLPRMGFAQIQQLAAEAPQKVLSSRRGAEVVAMHACT